MKTTTEIINDADLLPVRFNFPFSCSPHQKSKYLFRSQSQPFHHHNMPRRKTTTLSNRIVTNLYPNFLLQACNLVDVSIVMVQVNRELKLDFWTNSLLMDEDVPARHT